MEYTLNKRWLFSNQRIDDRYHKEKVVSHNGNEIEAINISTAQEILNHKLEEVNVIGIDEVQFLKTILST